MMQISIVLVFFIFMTISDLRIFGFSIKRSQISKTLNNYELPADKRSSLESDEYSDLRNRRQEKLNIDHKPLHKKKNENTVTGRYWKQKSLPKQKLNQAEGKKRHLVIVDNPYPFPSPISRFSR